MGLKKVSAQAVAEKIINEEELFILDVRNEAEFNDWHIEGHAIEILNKPYFELLEGIDSIQNQLPVDKPILVVCAKEGSSEFVAEMIAEAGFKDVMFMAGGMQAWSEHLFPVKLADLSDGGLLYQFVRIGKGCLSYVMVSGGEAIIIDPARLISVYQDFLTEKGWSLKHIVDTHLHADHISGGPELAEKTGATYWLAPKDGDLENLAYAYEPLTEESQLTLGKGSVSIDVLYTPGHTIGSTSLVIDNQYLLTGDILFIASIGRPDLAGKASDWADLLYQTLYKRYKALSDHLIVLPAHYGSHEEMNQDGSVYEKLGVLYEKNAGLNIVDEKQFISQVSENLPPQPNSYQTIRQTNAGKQSPSEDDQSEMEIGPNRCAITE